MNTPDAVSLVVAGLSLLVALIFGIIAQSNLQIALRRGIFAPLMRVATLVCACLALIFVLSTIFALIPYSLHTSVPPILRAVYIASDVMIFVTVALFAHLVQLLSLRQDGPSGRWLAWNYGAAAAVILVAIPTQSLLGEPERVRTLAEVAKWAYAFVVIGLSALQLARRSDRASRRPRLVGMAARSDVWTLSFASLCIAGVVALHLSGSWAEHRPLLSLLGTLLGAAIAVPFVTRNLGVVLSGILSAVGLVAASGVAVWTGIWLGDRLPTELRLLAPLATIVLLLLALGPGQPALVALIDRGVFRRSRLRQEEVAHYLRSLSPDLGPNECSLRAMRELRRVLRLRGAALIFRDAGALAVGDLDAGPIEKSWPRGDEAEALLDRPRFGDDQIGLPQQVREVLMDQIVLGIVAVRGSNRLWGHLLLRPDLVTTVLRDEGTVTVEIFADQLAVLLDAASLLDRAVEMERSLAHSEKLAAMGELAARIVHDIRNPITAARSLAQQLAREGGADEEAHRLIVEELERVDRHVAELLRFSRRDELDRQPVDLSSLVSETVSHLRARLEGADISVVVSGPKELVVSADREKIRHVLINLIENAADALSGNGTDGRVSVELEGTGSTSRLCVSDNGPGIPERRLEEIFEPFVSSKPKGTGLGLAIVKRTVEAHGGQITARSNDGPGVSFVIDLPNDRSTSEGGPA